MPTIQFFGAPVRVRPMLDAIGAQEALESHGKNQPLAIAGLSRHRAWERERWALARRRNGAERKLRPEERAAWGRWRAADEATRAAGYAVLTDLSG